MKNAARNDGATLHIRRQLVLGVCVLTLFAARLSAQDTASVCGAASASELVAATVDGVDIYVAQVNQHVQRVLGTRAVDESARQRLQAESLDQLVKQQIVLTALEKRGEACSAQQLDLALARFRDELGRQEKTLEEYCRAQGVPVAGLERTMRWQLSWSSYLQKTLTDAYLQQYFADHRADFDGTKMRVAQILLVWPDDATERAKVEQQAQTIRADILAGKISFAAAARQYSASPSGRAGGALEWISRHEPMPEFFAQAAFRLATGEISPPVTSPLGVHLIQCVEIEPGQQTWQAVRDELMAAAREHLFESDVTQSGTPPAVKYTGAVPHFRPGTRDVVVPGQDADPPSKRTGT
jgi:hypothetical protein